jgi:hypothetical protein
MQESCRECCGKHQEQLCGKKDKSYNSPTGDAGQPMTYTLAISIVMQHIDGTLHTIVGMVASRKPSAATLSGPSRSPTA